MTVLTMVTVFCRGILNALVLAFSTAYENPTNPTPKEKTRMKPGIEGSWLARVNADAPKTRRKNPTRGTATRRVRGRIVCSEQKPDEEKRLSYVGKPLHRRIRRFLGEGSRPALIEIGCGSR